MELGAFSISLSVKDIALSRAFCEKLGFRVFGAKREDRWLIMKSGTTLIGRFQGMFEKNMLTFNPGWDADAQALPRFTDVWQLQQLLKAHGGHRIRGRSTRRGPGPHRADGRGRESHPHRSACAATLPGV